MKDRKITTRLMALAVSAILVLTTVFNSVTVYADNGENGFVQQEKQEDTVSSDLSDENTATSSNAERDQENAGSDDIVSDDMTDEELSELVGELTEEELYELSDEGKLTKKVINGIGDVEPEESIDVDQYIDFTCIVDDEDDQIHTDLKDYVMNDLGVTSLEPGLLENTAPEMFGYNGYNHLYHRAVVENTPVYYVGILDVGGEDYVYYTTSKENTDRTVYSVLKDGEQINLLYVHKNAYKIGYVLEDQSTDAGADTALTEDDVFGDDRTEAVEDGGSYLVHVKIPRGYTATVEVTDEDGNPVTTNGSGKDLGKMMSYNKNGNNLVLTKGSPQSMVLSGIYQIDNVMQDQTVTVRYKKINIFQFNGNLWSQTVYAKNRLNSQNLTGDITDHTYTWKFTGITYGGTTWEMDQLNFNGEAVEVPMVKMRESDTITNTTVLSTGTVVTISVKSNGGRNGSNAARDYTVEISNCYEDITVSGGNMVSHSHQEIAVRRLSGVTAQFWSAGDGKWPELRQDGLIGRKNPNNNRIRFTVKTGYGKPVVRLLSKDAKIILQENDNNSNYFQYIYYPDEGKEAVAQTYDSWTPSYDKRYYLKTTDQLITYMNESAAQGVLLLEIEGTPTKVGVAYLPGGDQKDENGKMISPASGNIINMPKFDEGGEKGYNIENNEHVPISSMIPKDLSGNFEFDHWQILTVDSDGKPGKPKDGAVYTTGQSTHLTADSFDRLSDCYYWDKNKDRTVFTMQAVWKSENVEVPINYDVYCYLDGQQIYTETHTANKGATVLVDAWKSGTKTFSDAVNRVLTGTNNSGKDYTQNGTCRYLIDEEKSVMKLDDLQPDNNILYVYFVTADTQWKIQKQWVFSTSTNQTEAPVDSIKVQLQRKTADESVWKNVNSSDGGVITLHQADGWNAETGRLPLYQNDDLTRPYTYRILEMDENDRTVEEGDLADFASGTGSSGLERKFLVNYQKQGDTWTILNAETPAGALKISNTVAGAQGDKNADWKFTVEQIAGTGDQLLTGPFGGMDLKNGLAHFTLKHGESIIGAGLPAGYKFKVTEINANQDGYVSECNGTDLAEGGRTFTVEANRTVVGAFYNKKDLSKATVFLKAVKYVNGSVPSNDQKYTFYLKDDSGHLIQTVQNEKDQINFNKLEFSQAGTYTYYLMEADGGDPHVQYSQLIYEADVTVKEIEKEGVYQLAAEVVYKNTGSDEVKAVPEFHNQVTDAAYAWVSVMKQWKDDETIHRPESVTVQLYKDQQPYGDAKILSSEDNWTYTWTGLDRKGDWIVSEVDVPEGYDVSVTHSGNNWVITNTGKTVGDNGDNGNNGSSSDNGMTGGDHEGGNGGYSSGSGIAYTSDASDGPGQQKGTTPSSAPGKTDPSGNSSENSTAALLPDQYTIDHSMIPGAGAKAPSDSGLPANETGLPKTGDQTNDDLWPLMMVQSFMCMLALLLKKKKR